MPELRKLHWENIYQTRQPLERSWTEFVPETSLQFIRSFMLPKTARIIDIGGGDSLLVDHLLKEGYTNITVLDISAESMDRARKRLGKQASMVTFIESDITEFKPEGKYDCWHDRATFHFLTTEEEVRQYLQIVGSCVKGYMVVGTFSKSGPEKCSGLPVRQYDDDQLTRLFNEGFDKIRCVNVDHSTPYHTLQNFVFCSFRRQAA